MSSYTEIPAPGAPASAVPDMPGYTPIEGPDELSFEDVHGDMSWLHKALIGMGRGAADLGQGAKQAYYMATDPEKAEEYTRGVNEDIRIFEQLEEETPSAAILGRIFGAALPGMVAAPVSWPAAAALGAAEGATMFTPEADWSDKGVNALVGGGTAGVMQGLLNMFTRLPKPSTPEAAAAVRTAADEGVGLRPQDVSENPMVQLAGTWGEAAVPVRPGAAPGAEAAARDLVEGFTDNGSLLSSARQFMETARTEQNRLYGELTPYMEKSTVRLKADPIRARADELIAEQKASGLANPKIIKQLERIKAAAPEGNTFNSWKKFRTQLSNQMINWDKKGIDVAPLKQIYEQVTLGLQDAANLAGGDAAKLFEEANALTTTLAQMNKTPVARLVQKGDDTKLTNILRGKGDVKDSQEAASALFTALDDAGRETGRARMLNSAFQKSMDNKGRFVPSKFAQNLRGIEERAKVFFQDQPEVATRMSDMANMMAHVKDPRVAQDLSQIFIPATMAGLSSGAAAVTGAMDPAAASLLGIAASQTVMPLITRSRSADALLAALRKYEPGSEMSERIIQELLNLGRSIAPQGAAVGVTQPEAPPLQIPIIDGQLGQ